MSLLEVRGLTAGYGRVDVLRGLDFTVEPGEVVVVLGANGAGKTTTLRAVSGQISRRGSVLFDGKPIERQRPDAIVRLGVAQVPQGRGTIPSLTVDENLQAGAYIRKDGDVRKDIERWYELFPRLSDRHKQKAGLLSGGEQQMLAIARALMSRPALLLCDEPSLGLAPIVVQNVFATLRQLNEETGLALLMVEQNASLALEIASRAYVLEVGEIAASGNADDMRRDDAVRKAYLGIDVDLLIARIVDGLNSGVIYAFMAVALVMVFKGSGHLNIAQGQMAMITAYIAYEATRAGVPVWAACIVAVIIGFALGGIVERCLIRPLGPHSERKALLVGIGLLLAIDGLAAVIWDVDPLAFPTIVPSGGDNSIAFLDTRVQNQQVLILALLLIVLTVMYLFFTKTKLGLAMRTAADNPDSATLLGIRVGFVNALSWAIAAAVASLAAVLIAPSTTLTPAMMFGFLLYGIAAALLGGFDSPGGALVAGLFLGVAESLVAGYVELIGQDLKQAFALVVILVVLLARPSGLFGSARVERV